MPIKLGNNGIDKAYLGDIEVTKLYLGDTLVFGSSEAQPIITLQPVNVTVTEPDSATLTMTASDALTYQWYTSVDDQPVVGETGTSLIIDPTSESISGYYCIATNITLSAQTDTAIVTVEAVAADCVLNFDGTSYAELPEVIMLGDFSIEFAVTASELVDDMGIFGEGSVINLKKDDTAADNYIFSVGVSSATVTVAMELDAEVIIKITKDSGIFYKLFINGNQEKNEYNEGGFTVFNFFAGAINGSVERFRGSVRYIDIVDLDNSVNDISWMLNSESTTREPSEENPTDPSKDLTYTSVAPEDWDCPVALEALVDDNGEGQMDDSGELLGAEIV